MGAVVAGEDRQGGGRQDLADRAQHVGQRVAVVRAQRQHFAGRAAIIYVPTFGATFRPTSASTFGPRKPAKRRTRDQENAAIFGQHFVAAAL